MKKIISKMTLKAARLLTIMLIACQAVSFYGRKSLKAAEQIMPVETQKAPEISVDLAASDKTADPKTSVEKSTSASQFMLENENSLSQKDTPEMSFKETVQVGASAGEVKITELGPAFPKDGSMTIFLKKTSDNTHMGNLGQKLEFRLNKMLAPDGSVVGYSKTISGLTPGETYSYYFEIRDKKGVLVEKTEIEETKTQQIKIAVDSVKTNILDAEFIVSLKDENGNPIKENQRVFIDIEDGTVAQDGRAFPLRVGLSRQSDGTYRVQLDNLEPNKSYRYQISVELPSVRTIKVAVLDGEFRTKAGPPIEDVRYQVTRGQQLAVEAKITDVPAGASVGMYYEQIYPSYGSGRKGTTFMTTESNFFPNLKPLFVWNGCAGKPDPVPPPGGPPNPSTATYKGTITGDFPPAMGLPDTNHTAGTTDHAVFWQVRGYRFYIAVTLKGKTISRWPVNNGAYSYFTLTKSEQAY